MHLTKQSYIPLTTEETPGFRRSVLGTGTHADALFLAQNHAVRAQPSDELGDPPMGTARATLGVSRARLAFLQPSARPYARGRKR